MATGGITGKRRAGKPATLDLNKVRSQIDAIDEKIHALINDRARLAQQVGISKTQEGKTVDCKGGDRLDDGQVLGMNFYVKGVDDKVPGK